MSQIDQVLTDFGLPVGPFGMQDIAGIDVGARIRQYLKSTGKRAPKGRSRRFRIGCSRWAATARRPAPAGTATSAGSRNAHARSADRSDCGRGSGEARHHAAHRRRRRDHRADHHGARQRRRAGAGGRLRHSRRRHRRHLRATASGFPRHRGGPMFYADTVGLADRAGTRQGIPRAVRRLLGAGAACSSGLRAKAAGSTSDAA